jgi:hypothetical protein
MSRGLISEGDLNVKLARLRSRMEANSCRRSSGMNVGDLYR